MAESQVEKLMKLLGVDESQAKQIIADDKKVDKGEPLEWDLTDEQKKNVKEYTKVGTRKTTKKVARERKADNTKREIIEILKDALQCYENVTVENVERIITFNVGDDDFSVTLTKKRKK